MIPAGMVAMLRLRSTELGHEHHAVEIFCTQIDAEAYWGFPGDIACPKSSWVSVPMVGLVSVEIAQAEQDIAWERHQRAQAAHQRPAGVTVEQMPAEAVAELLAAALAPVPELEAAGFTQTPAGYWSFTANGMLEVKLEPRIMGGFDLAVYRERELVLKCKVPVRIGADG